MPRVYLPLVFSVDECLTCYRNLRLIIIAISLGITLREGWYRIYFVQVLLLRRISSALCKHAAEDRNQY